MTCHPCCGTARLALCCSRMLWIELLMYGSLYAMINLLYRLFFNAFQRDVFERLVIHCGEVFAQLVTPSFLFLCLYSGVLFSRWWHMKRSLPQLNDVGLLIRRNLIVEEGRHAACETFIVRETLARYLVLVWLLHLLPISSYVKKRFVSNVPLHSPCNSTAPAQPSSNKNEFICDTEIRNEKVKTFPCQKFTEKLLRGLQHDEVIGRYFPKLIKKHEMKILVHLARSFFTYKNYKECVYRIWSCTTWLWMNQYESRSSQIGFLSSRSHELELLRSLSIFRQQLNNCRSTNLPCAFFQLSKLATYVFSLLHLISWQVLEPINSTRKPSVNLPQTQNIWLLILPLLQLVIFFIWFNIAHCFAQPFNEASFMQQYIDSNVEMLWRCAVEDDLLIEDVTDTNFWSFNASNQNPLDSNKLCSRVNIIDDVRSKRKSRAATDASANVLIESKLEVDGVKQDNSSANKSNDQFNDMKKWKPPADDTADCLSKGSTTKTLSFDDHASISKCHHPVQSEVMRISDSLKEKKMKCSPQMNKHGRKQQQEQGVHNIGQPILISASLSPVKLYGAKLRQLNSNDSAHSASTSPIGQPRALHTVHFQSVSAPRQGNVVEKDTSAAFVDKNSCSNTLVDPNPSVASARKVLRSDSASFGSDSATVDPLRAMRRETIYDNVKQFPCI